MNTAPNAAPLDPWYVEGKDGHYLTSLEPETWSETIDHALRLEHDEAEHLAERRGDATARQFPAFAPPPPNPVRALPESSDLPPATTSALVVPSPSAPAIAPPPPPPVEPAIVDACARAGHEVLRAYCIARRDPLAVAPPPWDSGVSESDRGLVRLDVEGILAGRTPEESHALWLAAKREAGWKYGATKDAGKKEDPHCVPYAELWPEQRTKDDLFGATVRKLASALFLHFPDRQLP